MNNIDKVKSAVVASEFDAVLITSEFSRRYATGFHSTAGIAVVASDGAWFFTDSRYFEAAMFAIENADVIMVDSEKTYITEINRIITESGIGTIAFEQSTVTYLEYERWSEKLTAQLVPMGDLLSNLRMVKSWEDLRAMKKAQKIAERSFLEILPVIDTDITEKELAAELICRFLQNGADTVSFDPIIVSGERSSLPHGVPSGRKIQKGFLTMDFGVIADGWCSDTTRTVSVGKPTDEMRKVYDTVLRAQIAGIAATHAGAKGCEIDGAARDVITAAGYGKYFGHSFGHGLGLEVHESPNVAPSNDKEIPAGAVISAEPGIYLPGRFGVRIEDVLYVTEDGSENITDLSKELLII